MSDILGKVDLTNCEREPIHIPGKIQPHGFLIAVRGDATICHTSDNIRDLNGFDAERLVGQHLENIFSDEEWSKMQQHLGSDDFHAVNPLQLRLKVGDEEKIFNIILHRSGSKTVLEFEPFVEEENLSYTEFYRFLNHAVSQFQQSESVGTLYDAAAVQFRKITGFDRVMIYRFDEEWNGHVVAEAAEEGLDSYLDLHFPASDIPAQARELYRKNWIRIIPDVSYTPSGVQPVLDPETEQPLDMSDSVLRSVSPIHIEYLKNMQVAASMSISIIHEDRLWGLIACHNLSPRYLPYSKRNACEFLAKIFSYHLALKKETEDYNYAMKLRLLESTLLDQMSRDWNFVRGLTAFDTNLLHLVGASGALIHYKEKTLLFGETPSEEQAAGIIRWLNEKQIDTIFYTNHLSKHIPEASEYKDIASGMLAISISKSLGEYVIWFRPEVVRAVSWAGNPEKPVTAGPGGAELHPRKSFEAWIELVRDLSESWHDSEIDIAMKLREHIIEIILKNYTELRHISSEFTRTKQDLELRVLERTAELEKINRALSNEIMERRKAEQSLRHAKDLAEEMSRLKSNFLANMSHEIRTPINGILGMIQVIEGEYSDEILQSYLGFIRQSGERLLSTISSLLQMARIQSEKTDYVITECELPSLISTIAAPFAERARERKLSFEIDLPGDTYIGMLDCNLFEQIMSSLLDNAVKFTEEGGIKISMSEEKGFDGRKYAVIRVQDTGVGISREFLPKIFIPFEQESKGLGRKFEGSGLGLSIVKRYTELLGGRISVESTPGEGSTFTLRFPIQRVEKQVLEENE